jgi:hypothetical protein
MHTGDTACGAPAAHLRVFDDMKPGKSRHAMLIATRKASKVTRCTFASILFGLQDQLSMGAQIAEAAQQRLGPDIPKSPGTDYVIQRRVDEL